MFLEPGDGRGLRLEFETLDVELGHVNACPAVVVFGNRAARSRRTAGKYVAPAVDLALQWSIPTTPLMPCLPMLLLTWPKNTPPFFSALPKLCLDITGNSRVPDG
jgi:hypothetical protein